MRLFQFSALREKVPRERQVPLSRKSWRGAVARASVPWHALTGEQAPDLARAEGGPIVDDPGECWTLVR